MFEFMNIYLAPGEYSTRLKIIPIIDPNYHSDKPSQENVGIQLNLVFTVSIPIIIRHGVGSVNIIPDKPKLVVIDNRTFNKYFTLMVIFDYSF